MRIALAASRAFSVNRIRIRSGVVGWKMPFGTVGLQMDLHWKTEGHLQLLTRSTAALVGRHRGGGI